MPYVNAVALPEDLSEDEIASGLQRFETSYRRLVFEINALTTVDNLKPPTPYPAENLISHPRLTVPKFNGTPQSWDSFISRFEALVNSNEGLSPLQKFQYLLDTLEDSKLTIIQHFDFIDSNYPLALNALKEHFHNPRRLIQYHATALSNLPHVKPFNVNRV